MHSLRSAKDESAVRAMISAALAGSESACLMHRLDCVLLVFEGRSLREVADWFGVGKRSVQRWVHAVYERGLDGLRDHRKGGRPSKLTCEREQAVRRDLQVTPGVCGYPGLQWTGKRLAMHLDKRYAVEVSVRTCQRMIARSRTGVPASR